MAAPLPNLPSLDPFLSELAQLITSSSPPSSIFVHCPSNPSLLPALLPSFFDAVLASHVPDSATKPSVQSLLPRYALLDLRVLLTPRAVFDKALNVLSAWEPAGGMAWNERHSVVRNWDGQVTGLKVVASPGKGNQSLLSDRKGKQKAARQDNLDGDNQQMPEEHSANGSEPTFELKWTASTANARRDNLAPLPHTPDAFHASLRTILRSLGVSSTAAMTHKPDRRFLIFHHGEMLHDLASSSTVSGGAARETGLAMTLPSTFYRLEQLADVPITTIVLSTLSWMKAREGMVGLTTPSLLTTPELSPQDAVTLLTSRFAVAFRQSSPALFSKLVSLVHTNFSNTTSTSLHSLSPLCASFYPSMLAKLEAHPDPAQDLGSLQGMMRDDFQRVLPQSPTKLSAAAASQAANATLFPLSALAKVLLLAAYLAGTNPPKTDVRCFVKLEDRVVKKGKKAKKTKAKNGSPSKSKVRAHLMTGKAFPLERLLAIFEAILPHEFAYASGSPTILSQIATLVRLKLLTRQSSADKLLDGVKLRCRLSRDVVNSLANSIRMAGATRGGKKDTNWVDYLWDAGE